MIIKHGIVKVASCALAEFIHILNDDKNVTNIAVTKEDNDFVISYFYDKSITQRTSILAYGQGEKINIKY